MPEEPTSADIAALNSLIDRKTSASRTYFHKLFSNVSSVVPTKLER